MCNLKAWKANVHCYHNGETCQFLYQQCVIYLHKIDGKGSLRHHCILGLSECFYYFLSHERQNSSAKDGVDPLHLVLFCFIIAFIAQSIEHSL